MRLLISVILALTLNSLHFPIFAIGFNCKKEVTDAANGGGGLAKVSRPKATYYVGHDGDVAAVVFEGPPIQEIRFGAPDISSAIPGGNYPVVQNDKMWSPTEVHKRLARDYEEFARAAETGGLHILYNQQTKIGVVILTGVPAHFNILSLGHWVNTRGPQKFIGGAKYRAPSQPSDEPMDVSYSLFYRDLYKDAAQVIKENFDIQIYQKHK